MIALTIVWCTAVVLATPQNQNSLPTISNSLPSELYASSTSGNKRMFSRWNLIIIKLVQKYFQKRLIL